MQCAVLRRVSIMRRVKIMKEKLLEKRKCPESYIKLAKRIGRRENCKESVDLLCRTIKISRNDGTQTIQEINLGVGKLLPFLNIPAGE